MAKAEKKTKNKNKFRPGRHGGCEARVYEFREQAASPEPDDDCLPEPTRNVPRVVLIAAETLDEALAYLRYDTPDFDVRTVNCVGLIIMVSGSTLN